MSQIRLIVRDAHREIYGDPHANFVNSVVAALTAEPETIEELEAAIERFEDSQGRGAFATFKPGAADEPYDAGLAVVDLAARLVVCDSTYSVASSSDVVEYHDGTERTEIPIRYQLSDDWQILDEIIDWQASAEHRRRQREAHPPLDVRAVVYGRPLLEFIAREALQAGQRDALSDEARAESDREERIVRDIHARWLMTPRADLREETPREWLLQKQDFINLDLQYRASQWSRMERAPPALDRESHAYRYAGFGTHELVEYYELVRELIWNCRDRAAAAIAKSPYLSAGDFLMEELPRLELERDAWLRTPDPECHERTPESIIDNERRRMPEAVSGSEAMADPDCPCCQMLADLPGPTFWHLDGCNMDDEFAFSIMDRTQADWDERQREYEELDERLQERKEEQERLGVSYESRHNAGSLWSRSFSVLIEAELPLGMRLFDLGDDLARLIVELKRPKEERGLIDALNRDFGDLRDLLNREDSSDVVPLLRPVLDRFRETLAEASAFRPDLGFRIDGLLSRLQHFLEPPVTHQFGPHDIPF
jgi:hypothetical protein